MQVNKIGLLFMLLLPVLSSGQKKAVTLEEIYGQNSGVFATRTVSGVNWMKSGGYYSTLEPGKVVKYNISTGQAEEVLFDQGISRVEGTDKLINIADYELSDDENRLLLTTDPEAIYRRSFKAEYYVFDRSAGKLTRLSDKGKQQYATFSPDGEKVAFVRDNNLFVKDLAKGTESAVTTDGKFNHVINGAADWVYEEEFAFAKAFSWSPDGQKIAYYRFDESQVAEYNMQLWGGLYPNDYRFKYPKAGEANSVIEIRVYHLESGKHVSMEIGSEKDIYIPRMQWTKDNNLLSITRMNRLQNQRDIIHADAETGAATTVLTEKSEAYVDADFTDDLIYLKDGKHFIYSSEQSGFKHLYLYSMTGELVRQLTSGDWEVSALEGIDEKKQMIYFISTGISPLERHFYSLDIAEPKKKSKKYIAPQPKRLSEKPGTNSVLLNQDFTYYLEYNSSATTPPLVRLRKAPEGEVVRILEDNKALAEKAKEYNIVFPEFFQFKTTFGDSLNGWMLKPSDFNPDKKYPVLMFVYGGPGSQTVANSWGGRDFYWYQMLLSKGYMVVSIDNRGTGGRGAAFRQVTYGELGKLETLDQMEGAKYLGGLSYIDKNRIGIWGWSYGGYMSSLCMTVGAEYFKTGIAVAPVTTWRYYDTIYTERFLKRPQDNPTGYDDNSPINHAGKLKGNFLLVHGTADDNVHFQNAVDFTDALIKAGKQFDSFYYPNKNHGIGGMQTRYHLYQMMTRYLEENL